ncbi:ABC transporter permease [Candidatus Chlorohelix sp.]|uniref:ABC transporter permease n=1 Tax=Candidatus Chlorohelix sp. TaxID=3139201 RepID=UPI00302469A7
MNPFRLILMREFSTRVKKKSFLITIIITILVFVGYIYAPVIITAISGGSQTKLSIVNNTKESNIGGIELSTFLDDYLNTTVNYSLSGVTTSKPKKPPFLISYSAVNEVDSLKQKVRDGKTNGVLQISRDSKNELSFDYYTKDGRTSTATQRISDAATRLTIADRLARANVPPQVTTTPASIKVTNTDLERSQSKGIAKDETQAAASYGVVLILIIMLFISLNAFGSIIAQGVAEEKSSRVMEIMISAAKPTDIMFGKVFGIGLLGLVSILIVGVVAVPALLLQGPITEALTGDANSNSFNLAGFDISTFGFFLLFYLGGFFLYSMLYAAAGSLCSRSEDVSQSIAPISTLMMIAYFVAIFGLQAIDAIWVKALSFVPFFSPILMLARIGFGSVEPWEIALSILLLAGGIVVSGWYAARIYRAGVLLYGKRPSIRQALGLGRISK